MDKRKKIILIVIGVVVVLGAIFAFYLFKSHQKEAALLQAAAQPFNEATAPSYQKDAITFIKEIYSDARTVTDEEEFNKKIDQQVSAESKEFKQVIKDRKQIRDQVVSHKNIQFDLKEHNFTTPGIIKSTDKEILFIVNGTYRYVDLNDPVAQEAATKGEEVLFGQEIAYGVSLTKEGEQWKITNILSTDLTASYMIKGLDTVSSKSQQEIIDLIKKNTIPKYDLDQILSEINSN
ncbi:MAG: hypothetical protein RR626_02740 [Anaerovoracaceae bacterium]